MSFPIINLSPCLSLSLPVSPSLFLSAARHSLSCWLDSHQFLNRPHLPHPGLLEPPNQISSCFSHTSPPIWVSISSSVSKLRSSSSDSSSDIRAVVTGGRPSSPTPSTSTASTFTTRRTPPARRQTQAPPHRHPLPPKSRPKLRSASIDGHPCPDLAPCLRLRHHQQITTRTGDKASVLVMYGGKNGKLVYQRREDRQVTMAHLGKPGTDKAVDDRFDQRQMLFAMPTRNDHEGTSQRALRRLGRHTPTLQLAAGT